MKNNKLTRYSSNPLSFFDRDEFIMPFDRLFDEMMRVSFPDFGESFGVEFFNHGSYPKVDVQNFEDKIVIEAEVPGLTKEDIDIQIVDGALVLTCDKREDTKEEKGTYIIRELKRSKSHRTFILGDNIDKDNVLAEFKNGNLTITLKKLNPEPPEPAPKKIEIK